MIVFLKNVRLSFPDLWVPTSMQEGQTLKFGADLLLVEGSSVVSVDADGKRSKATMDEVLLAVADESWPGKGAKMLKALEPSKKCLRDGDSRMNTSGEIYDGYEGVAFVTAKNAKRPTIIGPSREVLTEQDGKPYSGCFVNAKIDIYAMKDPKRKGVFASLLGIQFAKDGDSFGGGAVANANDFDELEDDGVDDLA